MGINSRLRAGILTIGNEVLDGIVLDTNANWIEKQLLNLGVEIWRHATVRDTLDEIAEGLEFLIHDCDVIITSGGLGPTHDDMTLMAIAKYLRLDLEENVDALAIVQRQYESFHKTGVIETRDMTDTRRKMGIIPKGSIPLDNKVGGAPGVYIETKQASIFCLPGVPPELKFIWKDSVEPWLIKHRRGEYYQMMAEFDIIDESTFSPHISRVMEEIEGIWVKSMPKRYGTSLVLRVWISSSGDSIEDITKSVESAVSRLEELSGLDAKIDDEQIN